MCWFVTIGIDARGAPAIEALARQRAGLGVRASRNARLAAIFPKEDLRFELTHGGCSCELVPAAPDPERAREKQLRHRYERQGWSEAKIARAIHAAELAQARPSRRQGEATPMALFRNIILEQAHRLGGVRLFAHFYQGSQDDEAIACAGNHRVTPEQFAQGDFPPDHLMEVIP